MNYVRRISGQIIDISNNFFEFLGARKNLESLQNDGNTKSINSGEETERPHDELFVTSTPRTPKKKRPKIDGSIQDETNMDWSINPQPSISTTLEKSNSMLIGKCDFDKDEKKMKSKDKALAKSFDQEYGNYDDSDTKWQNDKEISLKEDLEAKEMMDDIIDSFETPKQAAFFEGQDSKNMAGGCIEDSNIGDVDIDKENCQRIVEEPYKNSNSTPNLHLNKEGQNASTPEKKMQESSLSEQSEESTLDESFSDDILELSRHSSDSSSIEENMWSLYSSSSDSASEGYYCKLCNYRTESLFVFERHQNQLEHANRETRLKTLQSLYVFHTIFIFKLAFYDIQLT